MIQLSETDAWIKVIRHIPSQESIRSDVSHVIVYFGWVPQIVVQAV